MDKKIYFIGNLELKENLERSLQLVGWKIEDFIGWHVENIIIYQLENIDVTTFHMPENLIIVTSNQKLKDFNKTNIFCFQNNNIKFQFSRYIIEYLKRQKNIGTDFYDSREEINLLYINQTHALEELKTQINRSNLFNIRLLKYRIQLEDQPIKTLMYFEAPENPIVLKNNILTIYKGYSSEQKKELKGLNPLAPKLFVNKMNKSTINKILKYLN